MSERKLEKQPVRKGARGTLGLMVVVEKLVARARVVWTDAEEWLVGTKGSVAQDWAYRTMDYHPWR